MFKISKLTDYATGVLSHMAHKPEAVYTARDITEKTHVNLPTVMKLLKLLNKSGLLDSHRGASGGYSLAHKPNEIRLIDVIEAIEGDVGLTECSVKDSHCSLEPVCNTRHNWQTISNLLYDVLSQITLAQMAQPLSTQQFQVELAGKLFTAQVESRDTGDAKQ